MTARPLVSVGIVVFLSAASTVGGWATEHPGRQKVQSTCAVCHGIDGIGRNPDVPNLAGESASYIERQLKAFKSGSRQHVQMSIIARSLADQDIRDLAAWYSSLKVKVEMPD
jgi:cytochrome c553